MSAKHQIRRHERSSQQKVLSHEDAHRAYCRFFHRNFGNALNIYS